VYIIIKLQYVGFFVPQLLVPFSLKFVLAQKFTAGPCPVSVTLSIGYFYTKTVLILSSHFCVGVQNPSYPKHSSTNCREEVSIFVNV